MFIPTKVSIHQSVKVRKGPVFLYIDTEFGMAKRNGNIATRMRNVKLEPAEAWVRKRGLAMRCAVENDRGRVRIKDTGKFTFENSFRHQSPYSFGRMDDLGDLADFLIRQSAQQRFRNGFATGYVAPDVAETVGQPFVSDTSFSGKHLSSYNDADNDRTQQATINMRPSTSF